jgi:hypothetical protein
MVWVTKLNIYFEEKKEDYERRIKKAALFPDSLSLRLFFESEFEFNS